MTDAEAPCLLELTADTSTETQQIGARLGAAMKAGDVLALIGPLGSGKTTFSQGLARGLEVPADRHVASPTFALVNEHPGRVPFVHADFYRMKDEAELRELGLEETYDRAATSLEWADRFPEILPTDHLEVTFLTSAGGVEGETRRIVFRATGPRSQTLLVALCQPKV